jgi:hypothetical protein
VTGATVHAAIVLTRVLTTILATILIGAETVLLASILLCGRRSEDWECD